MVNVRERPVWFTLPWLTTISACQTVSPLVRAGRSNTSARFGASPEASAPSVLLWGMRTLIFTDLDRDRESSLLGSFLFGGERDLFADCERLFGDCDRHVEQGFAAAVLPLDLDLQVDCDCAPPAAGLLCNDLDGGRFLGNERLPELERRVSGYAFPGIGFVD